MKKILNVLLLALLPITANAITMSSSLGNVAGFCGAYASVIKNGSTYDIYSNNTNNKRAACPGSGCPGITKYSGSLTSQVYKGVVIPNSIINDVFEADGITLAAKRMFSRPVVARDGLGYVAISMVSNNYPPVGNVMVPAFLTSPDGINWTYHGKLKGEATGYNFYGSGMALIVSDTSPRYRFYTDGYGVNLAGLYSDGGNDWGIVRTETGAVRNLRPSTWTQGLFHSIVELDGIYYIAAADTWPVTKWQFAYSLDGINFVDSGSIPVTSVRKNISLYVDNGLIMGLATDSLSGSNCYKKTIRRLTY